MATDAAQVALFSHHEALLLERQLRKLQLPVLLVGGQLGAGKTTLLNQLLSNRLNLRLRCIVNDLAKMNVDAKLLLHRDEATDCIELTNGCACHALVGHLEGEVSRILQDCDGTEQIDYIVLETSGVVDPVPLVESISRRFGKMTRARLDHVVIVVDADALWARVLQKASACMPCAKDGAGGCDSAMGNGAGSSVDIVEGEAGAERASQTADGLSDSTEMVLADLQIHMDDLMRQQLISADIVLLNKIELLPLNADQRLASSLRKAVPWARIVPCSYAKVPLATVMNVAFVGDQGGGPSHEAMMGEMGIYQTIADVKSRYGSRMLQHAGDSAAVRMPMSVSHADGFRTVHFTSDVPLRLSGLQDLFAVGVLQTDATLTGDGRSGNAADQHSRPGAGVASNAPLDSNDGVGENGGTEGAFTAHAPLSLANLRGLLTHVCRMKGVVWLSECRRDRWTLQLSGRQRVELAHAGQWTSPPRCDLVVIGEGWSAHAAEALLKALHNLEDAPVLTSPAANLANAQAEDTGDAISLRKAKLEAEQAPAHSVCRLHALPWTTLFFPLSELIVPLQRNCSRRARFQHSERKDAEDLILSDGRFDLLTADPVSHVDDDGAELSKRQRLSTDIRAQGRRLIHFQLVGTSRHGFSRLALQDRFGVDVDAMNSDFVVAVNAMNPASLSTGATGALKPLLTGASISCAPASSAVGKQHEQRRFSVRFAVGGACSLQSVWPVVSAAAEGVLARACAHVHYCRCDA